MWAWQCPVCPPPPHLLPWVRSKCTRGDTATMPRGVHHPCPPTHAFPYSLSKYPCRYADPRLTTPGLKHDNGRYHFVLFCYASSMLHEHSLWGMIRSWLVLQTSQNAVLFFLPPPPTLALEKGEQGRLSCVLCIYSPGAIHPLSEIRHLVGIEITSREI